MTTTVSTMEVRQNLGEILNRIALRQDEYIVERKGKPLAVMLPVARMEQMRAAARLHLLDVLERGGGKTPGARADRLANEAKHRSRKPSR